MRVSKRVPTWIGLDLVFLWLSVYFAFVVHDGGLPSGQTAYLAVIYGLVQALAGVGIMFVFGLYRRIWQYASVGELAALGQAALVSTAAGYLVAAAAMGQMIPLFAPVQSFMSALLLLGGSRFLWRLACDRFGGERGGRGASRKRTLIVGAGNCGTLFAKELQQNASYQAQPVAFVDDDPYKHRLEVLGIPVLGGRKDIPAIVADKDIEEIIIAVPSASKTQISEIVKICKNTKARLKIVPNLQDLIHGKTATHQIRDVSVEDLLGREPIRTDLKGIADYVAGKVVLVTGAGGSIGSELCRQIAPFQPERLLLLGHGENSIYTIEMEMRSAFPKLAIETVIADVQDRTRLEEVFRCMKPQVVFHAAAHKHVPLMERNPSEAIKNNVFGTKNVADCADAFGAERFVLISSDKAVNPTSVMGTTKRIAEMYIQGLDKTSETKYVAVRFGNVLGSRGSVIPRFKQQIASGGPVTVTHPEMVRYFMTIPEAVQLVIQAGAFAQGGEIFILDMGSPVRIYDLAVDLIRLSGFEPGVGMEITFSGIREGEKLYEELLTKEEGLTSTKHDRIYVGKPSLINRSELEFEFRLLERVLAKDPEEIRSVLQQLVPTYRNVS
ncbi:polysaccharide biosynthesis protein [Cohnella nanjingensis]|uniref:Polysaccharide biosynthesis protein n=1 Tax=Cohnella nanjingensis TaxID=1387779 RepID=A0A7X0RW89_9BACL|nr:nucleoside-diphosphate sugar epimerase/dehydratase [Cohnella nanjingensis]MBB6674808.1 polysaccharide biosynthesis protein [Cohnella nanjingensis]